MLFATTTFASGTTWNFVNSGDTQIEGGDSYGNYIDLERDGIELIVSAWSETKNNSDPCIDFPELPECQVADGSNESTERDLFIDTAKLEYYGNTLGVKNKDGEGGSPQHSIDNIPNSSAYGYNDYDMVLLQFNKKVVLDEIVIGWATNDGGINSYGAADISIVAYTGDDTKNANPFFANTQTWGDLLTSTPNWQSVENIENASILQAITNPVASQYFLIGAYNPIFGGNLSNANDGFKLSGVKTKTAASKPPSNAIPEPSSIALAFLGLLLLRRRQSLKK
ncbi:MAG: hypothetical protein ACJAS9_004096 [Polaribacter sp.]|jgi:hypothetical protein